MVLFARLCSRQARLQQKFPKHSTRAFFIVLECLLLLKLLHRLGRLLDLCGLLRSCSREQSLELLVILVAGPRIRPVVELDHLIDLILWFIQLTI